MKNFFTSMLGALVALIVFTVGGALLAIGVIGAIAALGEKKAPVEDGSYLVLDLADNITDAPPIVDFRALGSETHASLQLRTITRTLQAAATDSRIAGLLIKGDEMSLSSPGLGALREVRSALLRFKASGKPVKAYLSEATTKNYYLASVADDIVLDPYGMILMPGLAAEPMFFAGAAEKYGVGVQVTRVGKYKSFVEPFTRTDMSPENREQLQKLLDDLWGGIVREIAASRHVSPQQIQATVDAEGLIRADAAKAARLVDRVAYRDEIIAELKKATGRSGQDTFKQISLADYSRVVPDGADGDDPVPAVVAKKDPAAGTNAGSAAKDAAASPAKTAAKDGAVAKTAAESKPAAAKPAEPVVQLGKTRGRVAIVYAEGDIVDGEGDEPGQIGGTRFARELRRLRQDDDVKAIVLRVNSPGGSAAAAETIQREVRLAMKEKPVVVSMGSYAASGGYWISAYSDRIFAEPGTITGSIGVFGIQFDIQKLAGNFGVTFDRVKTGRFADTFTISRPKTPDEMAMFQGLVDWIYGEFITKVAEGRRLPRAQVEEIAQGRVWSGLEAKKLGLVDDIGGLGVAIRYAARKAGLGADYRLVEYPRKKDFAEALQDLVQRMAPNNARASGVVGQIQQRVQDQLRMLNAFNDPQGVYARLPIDLAIH
jgi:protease-4